MLKVSFGFVLGIVLCALWLQCRFFPEQTFYEIEKSRCEMRMKIFADGGRL